MKLLTGQANSGKSESIFTRMAELVANRQGNTLLITPSTNASDVLMKRLQAFMPQELPANSKPASISFPALSQRILKIAGNNLSFLTAIQRDRILRSVIAELAKQNALVYFDKTADKPGLAHTLTAFMSELWRSNITADDFANITQSRTKKAADIALIFTRYEIALKQANAIDAEGAGLYAMRWLEVIALSELAERERAIQNLKNNFVFIAADGFDFYTPVQVKMLSQLSKFGIEVMATLTFENERAVHFWQKRTLERFISEQAEIIACKSTLTGNIAQAAARLMSDDLSIEPANADRKKEIPLAERETEAASIAQGKNERIGSDSPGNDIAPIKIISAPDRAIEVRALAREIKRLVIEDSFAMDDITIVCRSLNMYTHHFERLFQECSIPLELDNQIALGENPFIVALFSLLGLGEKNFPRRRVIECLRSPYFNFSDLGLNEEAVDLLEHISLTEKVTKTSRQWIDAIKPPTPEQHKEDDEESENLLEGELRSTLAAKLSSFFDLITFKPEAQRREYVRQIEHLITTLKMSEKRLPQDGVSGIDQTAQDEAAQKAFFDLLKGLAEENAFHSARKPFDTREPDYGNDLTDPFFDNQVQDRRINWSVFIAELQRSIASTSFSRPCINSSAIVVQEVHNLRPRNYRAIFVVGLIEGEFPRKTAETTPYTLAEKIALRDAGIDFAETINDAGADVTQFHKAMSRASERLFLSYARTDFSGGEMLRSYLIDEVKAVAKTDELRIAQVEKEAETTIRQDVLSLDELAVCTARQMRRQFTQLNQANPKQSLPQTSIRLEADLRSWSATLRGAFVEQRRLAGRERGIFGGIIENQKLAEEMRTHFNDDYLWSASKINDYGLCPFLFFARNVLNLAPVEEPTEGFVADRLGTTYHEILEKTYRQLKEQGIDLTADSLEQATEIAEENCELVLQKLLENRKVRKSELWDFDKSEIKKRIVNLLRSEALSDEEQTARPVEFEQSFGYGNKPPLVISNSEGVIKIRGSIDRIDKTEDGLVVIDYKTSRSPISTKEALEGRNLQLPIYLMAANRVIKHEEPVTAGFYLHIYSCKRGSELPNKNLSLEDITTRAEAYIGEYVGKVRRAEFPVEPNQNRCPPYCKFDVMCRIQSLGSTTEDE
jgi:ATP-dependent helicase/nuclease subunit B